MTGEAPKIWLLTTGKAGREGCATYTPAIADGDEVTLGKAQELVGCPRKTRTELVVTAENCNSRYMILIGPVLASQWVFEGVRSST